MSDTEFDCIPPEVAKIVKEADYSVIPAKSSSLYESVYQRFIKWCSEKNIKNYSENVMLTYFSELANKMNMKSSTLWSQYSMIKSVLHIKKGVDISKYTKLRAYLRKKNEGYIPKKAKVFTKEQFERFLNEASDEQYLGSKVVLIIGISGACRCEEMVKMSVDHIQDFGSMLYIKIPNSTLNKMRSFTIDDENYINFYRKYASLRPVNLKHRRFFLKYTNGKCYTTVMGIHTIGRVPKQVATFLKLPNANEYTGRGLRRTSATLLVNSGPEGYIKDFLSNKTEIESKLLLPSVNLPNSNCRIDPELDNSSLEKCPATNFDINTDVTKMDSLPNTEDFMDSIPNYLKRILQICGFDTKHIIELSSDTWIEEIVQFINSLSIENILLDKEEDISNILGPYCKNPENFRIPPGHRVLLNQLKEKCMKIEQEYCQPNESESFNLTSDNASTSRDSLTETEDMNIVAYEQDNTPVEIYKEQILNILNSWSNANKFHLHNINVNSGIVNITDEGERIIKLSASIRCENCNKIINVYKDHKKNRWILSNFKKHCNMHSTRNKTMNVEYITPNVMDDDNTGAAEVEKFEIIEPKIENFYY